MISNILILQIIAGCGIIATIILLVCNIKLQNSLKAYKRELEKNSVTSDSNLSQVKVLQNKIEVLEKALKNALDK